MKKAKYISPLNVLPPKTPTTPNKSKINYWPQLKATGMYVTKLNKCPIKQPTD